MTDPGDRALVEGDESLAVVVVLGEQQTVEPVADPDDVPATATCCERGRTGNSVFDCRQRVFDSQLSTSESASAAAAGSVAAAAHGSSR